MISLTAIVGAVSTISATVLAWFVYRRSLRVDKVSEQAGIASGEREGIAQAFEGLKKNY